MFVFALFNLQGTVLSACRSRGELAYVTTFKTICQELFSSFFKFLFVLWCFTGLSPERLDILSPPPPFVKHYFRLFSKNFGGPYGPPIYGNCFITEYHQSGRNRRRFSYKPQQKYLHYPHPGRQRSYAPAGSSASQLPHGSWV